MAFDRHDYAGGAVSTTLIGTVTALSTSWQIADATGWPVGTNGPFYGVFNRLGPGPTEKVLCQSLSGSTITLADTSDRGVDGTTAQAWAAPTSFEHCTTAVDADEANLAVTQTVGLVTTKGDLLSGQSAHRFQRTGVGTNDSLLVADSSQPGGIKWAALPVGAVNSTAMLADGIVTQAKLASGFYGPYCRAHVGTSIPMVHDALTTVTWDTVDYDDSGMFTDNQTITVPVGAAGIYALEASISWSDPATATGTRRFVTLNLNGTDVDVDAVRAAETPFATSCKATTTFKLAAGDVLISQAKQDTVGTISVLAGATSYFAATWLRPA